MRIFPQQHGFAVHLAMHCGAPPPKVQHQRLKAVKSELCHQMQFGELETVWKILFQLGFLTNQLNVRDGRPSAELNDWLTDDGVPIIHRVAASGNLPVVMWLAKQYGCDQRDKAGASPGHYAIKGGHLPVLLALLRFKGWLYLTSHIPIERKQREIKSYLKKSNGQHPIFHAIRKGHHQVVRWLIEHMDGAKQEFKNGHFRYTPGFEAAKHGQFVILIDLLKKRGYLNRELNIRKRKVSAAFKYLLLHVCGSDRFFRGRKEHALHAAARNGHVSQFVWLVKQFGFILSDSHGCPPIYHAAFKGHLNLLMYLVWHEVQQFKAKHPLLEVSNGAVLKNLTFNRLFKRDGVHVIFPVIKAGYTDLAKWLLQYTAAAQEKNQLGLSPLLYAAKQSRFEIFIHILELQDQLGSDGNIKPKQLAQVSQYLIEPKEILQALHLAAQNDCEPLVAWLIKNFGCKQRYCGHTPGYTAVKWGSLISLKLMLGHLGYLKGEDICPDQITEVNTYLTDNDGCHAVTAALNTWCGGEGLDCAVWLLKQLEATPPCSYHVSVIARLLAQSGLNSNQEILERLGYVDSMGCLKIPPHRVSELLVPSWNSHFDFNQCDTLIKYETFMTEFLNAGIPLSAIAAQFDAASEQMKALHTLETAFIALRDKGEIPEELSLAARIDVQSILDILIEQGRIDLLNQMIARGDVLPPPQISLNQDLLKLDRQTRLLVVNAWSIFHAQRIHHALEQDLDDSALLHEHFSGLIQSQMYWPNLALAQYLPKLKSLLIAIKHLLEDKGLMNDYGFIWVQCAWPTLQPMATELTPRPEVSGSVELAERTPAIEPAAIRESRADSSWLFEPLLRHPEFAWSSFGELDESVHAQLVAHIAASVVDQLVLVAPRVIPVKPAISVYDDESSVTVVDALKSLAEKLGLFAVKSLLAASDKVPLSERLASRKFRSLLMVLRRTFGSIVSQSIAAHLFVEPTPVFNPRDDRHILMLKEAANRRVAQPSKSTVALCEASEAPTEDSPSRARLGAGAAANSGAG